MFEDLAIGGNGLVGKLRVGGTRSFFELLPSPASILALLTWQKLPQLGVLELAQSLERRKVIYEKLYPETKRGGDKGNQHTGGKQMIDPIIRPGLQLCGPHV